jgi:hypothetical protein
VPALHGSQELAPLVAWYVPLPHALQPVDDWPVSSWYCPGTHEVQLLEPVASSTFPAAQGVQLDEPRSEA